MRYAVGTFMQSAAHAKQVLEGHAMYEGGANVLRLSYSVHRDLNVKNSGDKSRDYSMPLGVPSSGYHQHGQQHHHQQQHYAPNPYDMGGHAPPPHHGGGQFGDEAPVTGVLLFFFSTSLTSPLCFYGKVVFRKRRRLLVQCSCECLPVELRSRTMSCASLQAALHVVVSSRN
jgi:hypothetical protein